MRKNQESSSGEYIAEDAPHWNAEAFIPVTATAMKNALLQRQEAQLHYDPLQGVFESMTSIMNHDYRNLHQQVEAHYAALDPDRDLKLLDEPDAKQREKSLAHIRGYLDDVLRAANFTKLDQDQIRGAMKGASYWGVRLNVNFDIFETIDVYARGDIIGVRTHRLWTNYWRLTEIEVPIYQRLVAVFKLRPDTKLPGGKTAGDYDRDRLHLSMFKNIPQADVDMLLPGTAIRFSWLDRTKIFAPTLGGLGVTLFKILRGAVVVAATGLAAVFGVVVIAVGVIGYIVRSVFSYFQTKDKYLLNLTRSLYFQKLDSNAGVIFRLLQEARQQDLLELIIAYFVLATAADSLTQQELQRNCQRLLSELLDIEIRYDAYAAIERLRRLGILIDGGSDSYSVLSPKATVSQLDYFWDNLTTCSRSSL